METDGGQSLQDFERIRRKVSEAEDAGNPAYFEEILADDAVIMPPWIPAVEGKAACMEFVGSILDDIKQQFDRMVTYTSAEVVVAGDTAFDRGTFSQTLRERASGNVIEESAQYLWIYRRQPGGAWKIARIIWNMTAQSDLDE